MKSLLRTSCQSYRFSERWGRWSCHLPWRASARPSGLLFARPGLAAFLCFTCAALPAWPQQAAIAPHRPTEPLIIRPYFSEYIPPIRTGNSLRIQDLVRAGKIYLTAQDAIALALENNIDIESARYNPLILQSQLRRQEAGGALAGIPSASSRIGTVQSGQGVSGSQQAAGVTGGGGGGGNATANATVTQIGPVTPVLDPIFQQVQTYSHISQPQPNQAQSQITNLIQNSRNYQTSIQQGLITGGQATLTYADTYLDENAPTNFLNPTNGVSAQLQVQHNFLRGFGVGVNSRNITVAKSNLKLSDTQFKSSVIAVVANVLNLYYGLVADYEDLRAKQSAVDVAQQFYDNNRKQVQLGSMAPLDITTAEAQLATSQQNLVVSQTTLAQQQISLKNVLSRNGLSDPVLRDADIIPLDKIIVPEKDDVLPAKELLATALKNRTDVVTDRIGLENARTSSLGTQNSVLPQLGASVSSTQQGLNGVPQAVPLRSGSGSGQPIPVDGSVPGIIGCPGNPTQPCLVPDPYFVGGIGTGLGQMVRRNFPTNRATAFFSANIRNRSAQADNNIDQLTLRQTELQNSRSLNQIAVTVSNSIVGLQQARARYQAALRNRVLSQQLLDAEQKKFSLGVSTTFNVVQQQRDLATAQSTEVAALVAFSNARVTLDQTVGLTLEQNHITVAEALDGRLFRKSSLPATLPPQP